MKEDDERTEGASRLRPVNYEIGQPLDNLSVSEIEDLIEVLKLEIVRLEEAQRLKQDSQAAAAAFFKF